MKHQLIAILACLSATVCFGEPQLAENADTNAFARQLYGGWVKCAPDKYTHPGETNGVFLVEAVSFQTNGVAEWRKSLVTTTGRYSVEFERPPAYGEVTFARISLTAKDGQSNIWTRVNFGQDNRFPTGDKFLRIEGPAVYQVFRKMNSQPGGTANGSQAVRTETNGTASAAGSRR